MKPFSGIFFLFRRFQFCEATKNLKVIFKDGCGNETNLGIIITQISEYFTVNKMSIHCFPFEKPFV